MSDNIDDLKKAVKADQVKGSKGVDMKTAKKILTDDKVEFTYLGSHATFPGKKGEYVYMVASMRADGAEPRTWGWVGTEKEARDAVACNAADMFEHYYRFAVIEKVASGICCIDIEQVAWFNWDGEWVEIPHPDWAEGVMGWTL